MRAETCEFADFTDEIHRRTREIAAWFILVRPK